MFVTIDYFKALRVSQFLVAGAEQVLYEHNLTPKGLAVVLLYAKRKYGSFLIHFSKHRTKNGVTVALTDQVMLVIMEQL